MLCFKYDLFPPKLMAWLNRLSEKLGGAQWQVSASFIRNIIKWVMFSLTIAFSLLRYLTCCLSTLLWSKSFCVCLVLNTSAAFLLSGIKWSRVRPSQDIAVQYRQFMISQTYTAFGLILLYTYIWKQDTVKRTMFNSTRATWMKMMSNSTRIIWMIDFDFLELAEEG